MTISTSLSNLEIIELKQFLWQFWLSLSFFVFFSSNYFQIEQHVVLFIVTLSIDNENY